jgi:hypothetical protein
MKRNILLCIGLLMFLSFSPARAQLIELDTPQDITVFGPGFYPFSDEANESFKELLQETGSVAVIIKNFTGKGLKVAPAADSREIGRKKKVAGDNIVIINYKKKKAKKFGLSFVPSGGSVALNLEVQPFAGRPCPNPVNCQDDCGENLGKCCEKNANGNQAKICVQVGTSSCGCANR